MISFLTKFRPSLPPVAVLVEYPSVLALRVAKPGRDLQALVQHEEAMTDVVDALGSSGGHKMADALLTRLGRPKRICLVLGDSFFRMQIMTLTDFPRREEERSQIILWHLRKTLNVPVETLRLRYEILQKTAGSVTLWLTLCQEDALAAVENAFSGAGCEVGYVGAASAELHNFALASGLLPEEGPALLLNRTPSYLSFLFTEGGQPVFFRCKETDPDEPGEGRIEQELRLTLAYHREKLGFGKLRKILLRHHPDGLLLPLDGVVDEDVPVETLAASSNGAAGSQPWGGAWLPLVALMEGD